MQLNKPMTKTIFNRINKQLQDDLNVCTSDELECVFNVQSLNTAIMILFFFQLSLERNVSDGE